MLWTAWVAPWVSTNDKRKLFFDFETRPSRRVFTFTATMIEELYHRYLASPLVSTDTRAALENHLFFCLKGPNFDANSFADEALAKGATHVVSDDPVHAGKKGITVVDDVLQTLQKLARHHRNHFSFPVIGLTGSNGKTTNKELMHAVLSQKYRTFSTKGNLNNHIGVPLTLLAIPLDAEMAVVEMGANHQREIAQLSEICDPDYGLITNIGKAHLEGFGGIEGVRKGKGELFDHLRQKEDAVIFLNADDEVLTEMAAGLRAISYGTQAGSFVRGSLSDTGTAVALQYACRGYQSGTIQTQLVGQYNFINVLAAICVGCHFEVPHTDIAVALESYAPELNRSQWKRTAHNALILDAYNANPSSMELALRNFAAMKAENKVAILGHMLELGEDADSEHQVLIGLLRSLQLDALLVGHHFAACEKEGFKHFDTTNDLLAFVKSTPIKNATVLLKGSRMVALEKVVDLL